MRIVSGLFASHQQAEKAVSALQDAGVASDEISLVSPSRADNDNSGAAEGAGVGAIVGGASGLLAGLGAFAIPGIGPVVGAGWLAATLTGALVGGAAGGVIGALTGEGVPEDDAHVYAEGIRRGGTLVTARVDETLEDAAAAVLTQAGATDVQDLRASYRSEGWEGFDVLAEEDAARAYDDRKAGDPIVTPFPR
jgi:hypothetical protein